MILGSCLLRKFPDLLVSISLGTQLMREANRLFLPLYQSTPIHDTILYWYIYFHNKGFCALPQDLGPSPIGLLHSVLYGYSKRQHST